MFGSITVATMAMAQSIKQNRSMIYKFGGSILQKKINLSANCTKNHDQVPKLLNPRPQKCLAPSDKETLSGLPCDAHALKRQSTGLHRTHLAETLQRFCRYLPIPSDLSPKIHWVFSPGFLMGISRWIYRETLWTVFHTLELLDPRLLNPIMIIWNLRKMWPVSSEHETGYPQAPKKGENTTASIPLERVGNGNPKNGEQQKLEHGSAYRTSWTKKHQIMFQDGYCLLMLVGSYIPSIKLRDLPWFFGTVIGMPVVVHKLMVALQSFETLISLNASRISTSCTDCANQLSELSPHFWVFSFFLMRDPNSWWVYVFFFEGKSYEKNWSLEDTGGTACSAPDSRPIALHGQHTDGSRWRAPGGWSSDHLPIFPRVFFH